MLMGDEQFVRSGDLRLWTERFGDTGDPAVLLVMGTAAQGIAWPDDLVAALAGHGRQVIRYDHRDTGRSDTVDFAERPYTLADLALDAVAVLDGHGVASADVVGISLGAAVGQWLAVHRPERVRTLTAISASPMGHDPGPAWRRAMTGQPAVPGELPPPAARFLESLGKTDDVGIWRVLNGGVLPFDEAAARRFVERSRERARNLTAALNHDLAGRRFGADRLAPLSRIAAPTLVVHGDADPLFPPEHGAAVAERIPGARLDVVPGMGHHPFFGPYQVKRLFAQIT